MSDDTGRPNGDGKVTFTVKELLQDIKRSVESLDEKLTGKVDIAAFRNLEEKVAALRAQVDGISSAEQTAAAVAAKLAEKTAADQTTWDRWRLKVAWAVGLAVAAASLYSTFAN